MPTLNNGGGLLLWLVILAVIGLGLLYQYLGRYHCDDCGVDVGRKPWYLDGNRLVLCRICFTKRVVRR